MHSRLAVLLLAALCVIPGAAAQDVTYHQGGEPGVRVTLGETAIELAQAPASAVRIDPSQPVNATISLAPPPGITWEVRAISIGLLVRGAESDPPEALTRRIEADATLPPGFTVILNRSIDLTAMERVGAGTFLMRAEVLDANETRLYTQAFFVRVNPGAASLLTAQGAALTAVSVAAGYGLWQVLKDIHEMREARERHRRRRREGQRVLSVDVLGTAEDVAEATAAKLGRPFAAVVGLKRSAKESERNLGPVRWTATGMGLGGVAIAWLQFFGYLALDVLQTVATALEVGAVTLTVALLVNALARRAREKLAAQDPASRSVPVQGPTAVEAQAPPPRTP